MFDEYVENFICVLMRSCILFWKLVYFLMCSYCNFDDLLFFFRIDVNVEEIELNVEVVYGELLKYF